MMKNWCEAVSKKQTLTNNNKKLVRFEGEKLPLNREQIQIKGLKIINKDFFASPSAPKNHNKKIANLFNILGKTSLLSAFVFTSVMMLNTQSVKADSQREEIKTNLFDIDPISDQLNVNEPIINSFDGDLNLDKETKIESSAIADDQILNQEIELGNVLGLKETNDNLANPTLVAQNKNQTPSNSSEKTSSPKEKLIAQNNPESGEEPRVLVAEVLVLGVEGELEDLVYNVIRTSPGRTTTRSQLQQDTNAIFATGFFSNVNVTPSDTPLGVRVTYTVEPNPVLQQVTLETLSDTPTESQIPPQVVQEAFEDQYGEIINLRDLQEGIASLNQWYSDNGFDLAQIVGTPQVDENGVVTLIIAEGEIEDIQVKFFNEDEDEIEGRTRNFIVTREVELKPGDIFNRNIARRDLQRVFGLGIFQDVRLSFSPAEDPSKVIVNVEVVEGNTGSIAAGAGISSSSGFFGTLSYQQQNLGGNNQTLGAEFQLGERELLFDLSLRDPWIATFPDRTSYTANLFRRRSISLVFDGTDTDSIRTEVGENAPRIVRTGTGVTFTRPVAPDPFTRPSWVLSAGLQYQRVAVQNADGDLSPRSVDGDPLSFSDTGRDDLLLVRLNASRDRRNNSLQPTEGSFLLVGMDQSVPVGSGNILLNRLRASYSYYMPVNFLNFDSGQGAQALAFNVQGGTVLGDLPPYEAFVLGGSNSVRGYGEGDLGNGRTYLQATAEYRFPIFSAIGGAVFLDYGTDLGSASSVPGRPAEVRGLNGSGFGYGLGVRIQSPVGPIRVDYGINDNGDNRIHFGIGEKF